MRRNWGVDVDGVLAVFDLDYVALLKDIDPDRALHARLDAAMPPKCWDWTTPCGVSPAVEKEAWRRIGISEDFWEVMDAYPSTIPFLAILQTLMDAGEIQVYFLTARPGRTSKQQTERWLSARGIRNPTVLICPGDKAPLIEGLGLDLMIDDRPDTIRNLQTHFKDKKTIIYCQDRPWNQDILAHHRVKDVMALMQEEGVFA